MAREEVLWTNAGRDDAASIGKRRWLLIGGSTEREYRGRLQELCNPRGISVDLFSTSLSVEDVDYLNELIFYFSYPEYTYDHILVALGYHHGMDKRICDSEAEYNERKKYCEEIIKLCIDKCPNVVMLSGTPEVLKNNVKIFNDDVNREIEARNKLCQEVADKYMLHYIDNYYLVKEFKHNWRYEDNVHFKGKNEYFNLAKNIFDYIEKL